ncbi:pilus assembly protein PilX [Prodigiosinella confusarubida]|uniref:Pilus assembly protein PilX n=1 Tax=Serratia sp. (strain ATCC 39006) TaxID=104623 RepID=A0A2I5TNT1_SERS3|nr:type 4 pilus major pilin [Serratia sp. ATCC 39006]AUH01897.1 pilus assembly protein PilX [Serratia sp. ATCC 39006]AUH06219.1 pilus assembly protein PilX [Serratia sp. ATCC 39006]
MSANPLSVSVRRQPHRGWGIIENGTLAILIIIVIVYVVSKLWGLWTQKSVAMETTNYQSLITYVRGNFKGPGGYDFTSASTMTGTVIAAGGAKGMTVQGDVTSGSATMFNTFGGQVILTPVASNGFNNGFSLSSAKIPQDACISIAQQMGNGAYSSVSINSTAHTDGNVTAETAAKECVKDSGGTGQNTLTFTVNG